MIPNPVTTAPSPEQRREKLIIAVGHLTPLKNFEDAIRAMASSRLEHVGWSMAVIGSGSCEPRLRKLIGELGLKRTQIHAAVDDLTPWYARASLLVVPSRLESFSLVLAEAMLSGVVPIAYASDGPSFILEGFPDHLVEMGRVEGLAECLTKFANEPDLGSLREETRRSIALRFSPSVVAEQWEDLFDACGETKPC